MWEKVAAEGCRMRGISLRVRCSRKEPLTRLAAASRRRSTLSHKGRGNFSNYRFSCFTSMRCPTRKCDIHARLHIGSKIGIIESRPDTGIVVSTKLTRAETIGTARRGSDIDLFGYSKSIINLDAEVAYGALDLGVATDCRCADRSESPWFAEASGCRKGAGPTQCLQSTRRRVGSTAALSYPVLGHA